MLSLLNEKTKNSLIKEERFFYLFAVLLLIIQISVFIKYFTIHCIRPDLLLVLLIFFSLNFSFIKSLKFAVFIGLLKDLLNPSYILFDVFIYPVIVVFIFLLKKMVIFENFFLRILLVVLASALYLGLKIGFIYIKYNFLPTTNNYIYFIVLNLIIFLIFNQIVENYKERDEF